MKNIHEVNPSLRISETVENRRDLAVIMDSNMHDCKGSPLETARVMLQDFWSGRVVALHSTRSSGVQV